MDLLTSSRFNKNTKQMKRVRIKNGYFGEVTRNDNYKKILKQGIHFISFFDKVILYDMSKIYVFSYRYSDMLIDENNVDFIKKFTVKNNEIALIYEGDIFKRILTTGEYFYMIGLVDYKIVIADTSKIEIGDEIDQTLLENVHLKYLVRSFDVKSNEEGLLFVNNEYVKKLNKGVYYFWKNTIPIDVNKVDLRQLQMEVSGQEILTKDKAVIRINFFAQYFVKDIEKALLETKDFEKQLYILIQLTLREFVGTMTLDELLDKKDSISTFVLKNLKDSSEKIGVEIINSGIRDIILTGEMKEIMNQVLIAQKKAQANVIMRREETASTRSLLNTAKLMEDNEMLFKLKEMEYVEKIAEKVGEITVSSGGQVLEQLKGIFTN